MTAKTLEEAWQDVRGHLTHMTALIDASQGREVDLMRFAGHFAALAGAYLQALMLQGKTSMRVEAAVRALNLRTPKSALLRFLERER